MQAEALATERGADLEARIQRRIVQRTWGRIRGLQVRVVDGGAVVRGVAPSYAVKQLALLAVREVHDSIPLALDIAVN
jgi:hypothetical protein